MSLSFQSGAPGLDFPLPQVDSSRQRDRSTTALRSRTRRPAARVEITDETLCVSAEVPKALRISPNRHLQRSLTLLMNGNGSLSASTHQHRSRARRASRCVSAYPRLQRHGDGLASSDKDKERNGDYVTYRGHSNVDKRGLVPGRMSLSLSQHRQSFPSSSLVHAAASTSSHSHIALDRGGGSTSLKRSVSATATTKLGGVDPLVSPNVQEYKHSSLHLATSAVSVSDVPSLSNAVHSHVKLLERSPVSLRRNSHEGVGVAPVSVELKRVTELAHTPFRPRTNGLLGASSSGRSPDVAVPSALGNTFVDADAATKKSCSRCKVEEEVLYSCPCGLARYCCTTCQRVHWPTHRKVCIHAVKATQLPTRRCDWCQRSSQSLRQCQCGFSFYCDTVCQRGDWPYHRVVCNTMSSQELSTALMCGQALRAKREAATQTVHWQMCDPADLPTGRGDGISGVDHTAGAGISLHASLHERHARSDSDEAAHSLMSSSSQTSFATLLDPIGLSHLSSSRRTGVRVLSEYGSQAECEASFGASAMSHHNREASVRASNGTDAVRRSQVFSHSVTRAGDTGAASYGFGSARVLSRSAHSITRSRHHGNAHSTNLFMSSTTTGQYSLNPLLDTSSLVERSQSLHVHPPGAQSHVAGCASLVHQYHQSPSLNEHTTYVNCANGPEIGDRSLTSMASTAARDHLGVVAFLVASRQIIEREETRERALLFRKFRVGGAELHKRLLGRKEEEERICILKEEVLWCIVTGNPAWRRLKQAMRDFCEARK